MTKFLQILAQIEGVEMSLLQSKIPLVSTGAGGNIISIALLAESEVSAFLTAFQKTAPPTLA